MEITLSLIFALAHDDLDLLASLLEESETTEERNSPEEEDAPEDERGEPDEYDELFDAEDDASYTEEVDAENNMIDEQKENLATLFGDVDDLLEEEEAEETVPASAPSQAKEKTNEELQGFCYTIFYLIWHVCLWQKEGSAPSRFRMVPRGGIQKVLVKVPKSSFQCSVTKLAKHILPKEKQRTEAREAKLALLSRTEKVAYVPVPCLMKSGVASVFRAVILASFTSAAFLSPAGLTGRRICHTRQRGSRAGH